MKCTARIVTGVTMLALVSGFAGCATPTKVKDATEDVIAWVRGALQTSLEAPLDRATRAADHAAVDLKFSLVTMKQDALTGIVTAVTAKDEKVEITLAAQGEKRTRVDIRVGLFNDKATALEILTRIYRNL